MRKLDSIRLMFFFCVLCALNTLLSPTFQRSFQIVDQVGAYALDSSLLEIIAAFPVGSDADELDDSMEDSGLLFPAIAFLYESFDPGHSKNKIPGPQRLLTNPFLEKSTPPPEVIA